MGKSIAALAGAEDGTPEGTDLSPASSSMALGHHAKGLDGLRAASMLAVLGYHGELRDVQGGFLGISLFFTLSGFLITSLLLRDHERLGSIDLRAFWSRRYRRLLPAAYMTLAGVLVFTVTVGTKEQVADIPAATAACLAQVANWFFIITGKSYVDLFSAPSPVAHFWSLAVEEQFYLVFPLAMFFLLRATRSTKVVLGALVAGVAASLLLTNILFSAGASIDRIYQGSDTRAGELLVGAVLAVVLWHRPVTASRYRRILPALGLVAAALTLWSWHGVRLADAFLYRGGLVGYSLLSVALILSVMDGRGPVNAVLSAWPVAAFGRITYGIYLFHWPLFLLLTEDRTGLSTQPLLAVRLLATVGVATISYHLVEMPIRQQAWRRKRASAGRPRQLRTGWLAVPSVLVLLVSGVLVGQRHVDTNLAGLGEAVAAMPKVAAQGDGVLDVLVIADQDAPDLGPELRAAAGRTANLRVAIAKPFSCSGVDPTAPTMCENWRQEWPGLVKRFNPDVVLFHVTRWDPRQIAALSGAHDLAGRTAWTVRTLDAGFDLLTARGATVVWSQDPLRDMAEAVRRSTEPFYPAILQVTSERPDARRREVIGHALEPLLADLSLYQRQDANRDLRVMVVGDSTARTVGYGLERWAADHRRIVVWSAAREGCGIADSGVVKAAAGRSSEVPAYCRDTTASWTDAVKQFDPDLVLVVAQVLDIQARRLASWPNFRVPGDPAFDSYLLAKYEKAYDILSARGARVVWFNIPCVRYTFAAGGGDEGAFDTTRVRWVNDKILGKLTEQRPAVHLFDLFSVLCPHGSFVDDLGNEKNVRPDGLHMSSESSLWFADTYGQKIIDLGRS